MPRTKKKVKPIVKTKVISARVTEAVYELLHQQAEDAGMTLSEFTAQMLMKGRVNTSYVFYVHPDEIEAITREFAAIEDDSAIFRQTEINSSQPEHWEPVLTVSIFCCFFSAMQLRKKSSSGVLMILWTHCTSNRISGWL